MDPLGKLEPDSGMLDPAPYRSEKQDPEPHQSEEVEASEGHFEALDVFGT
jgi:hypothetical protein